jgi:MFS transporter, PPP family, 3-phenylpropionic acid transporter
VTSFGTPFARFLVLYGTLYAAFGVQSPYLPSLLQSRNLLPRAIALVLAGGTAVRLLAGPAAGRLADRLDAPKAVFCVCAAAAALMALGYLLAQGLWLLFLVGVLHSAALAPLAPLSDTFALGTAAPAGSVNLEARGFHYGWVRGAGSAAFIVGLVLSGEVIGHSGIVAVVWLNAALLAAAALAGSAVPVLLPAHRPVSPALGKPDVRGVGALLRLPLYRVAERCFGTQSARSLIQVRCSSAKVNPCSGSIAASATAHVVSAIVTQRTMPARAASIAAPAGPSRSSSGRPITRKTTTSAATDSDHSSPAVAGEIPAASQRITAKLSCIAWLPRIKAATSTMQRGREADAGSPVKRQRC